MSAFAVKYYMSPFLVGIAAAIGYVFMVRRDPQKWLFGRLWLGAIVVAFGTAIGYFLLKSYGVIWGASMNDLANDLIEAR